MAKLPEKQHEILKLFYKKKKLTKKEVVEEFGGWYYCNESKHIGDILSRMVKRGLIHREGRGVYAIGPDKKTAPTDPNQKTLF